MENEENIINNVINKLNDLIIFIENKNITDNYNKLSIPCCMFFKLFRIKN